MAHAPAVTIWPAVETRDALRPAPPPRPRDPLFLADCATPADGGTVLLALWRKWDAED